MQELGHDFRLMPAGNVKTCVKRGKSDAADAEAICEAVRRTTDDAVSEIQQQHSRMRHLGHCPWTEELPFRRISFRGRAAAVAHTPIETAKMNGIDPQTLLAYTIARIPDYKITKVQEFLPWN